METGLTKNRIITELTRSAHGKLLQYVPTGKLAVKQEPEFYAHLIAWNQVNGQVRDSKVALPVISLTEASFNGELADNSFAHLAMLDPRNLVNAARFAKELKTPLHGRAMRRMVEGYLRVREAKYPWWEATAVQHRGALKTLYALFHIKPNGKANRILFKGEKPAGSVFEAIASLKGMAPKDVANTIMEKRIPFLIAVGALGARAKETEVVLALIEQMSATELVTNTKMLERLGVKEVPALRSAFEAGLVRVAASKQATFKTTRAAEAIGDEKLKAKLRGAQEKQIDKLGAVEGDWLVLSDISGSMRTSIDVACRISATLARMAKGQVHLVFFNTAPRYINATGKDYEALLHETRLLRANGGTSIGCGLQYAIDAGLNVDGIAIISDGGENQAPFFTHCYQRYAGLTQKEPPVYLYRVDGDDNAFAHNMTAAALDLQEFDVSAMGVDYYSLPSLIATMSTRRYGLVDAIMETPLLKLQDVLNRQ